ncbi:MAG: hypothetical protein AB7P37_19185 [Ramlibacter sp.]
MTRPNTQALQPMDDSVRSRLARVSSALLIAALMTGCAGTVDKTATSLDLTKESIVVMSMRMTNELAPTFKPTYLGYELEEQGAQIQSVSPWASASPTGGASAVPTVRAGVYLDRAMQETLVVVRARPGKYSIQRLVGRAGSGLVVGDFMFEVDAPVEIPRASIVYLGHLDLVNKSKTSPDDQSTGLAVPVLSQGAAGFIRGTLGVSLTDRYERDMDELKVQYPAMKNLPIVRSPLSVMQLRRTMGSKAPNIVVKQSR